MSDHPWLGAHLGSDMGIRLMYTDSLIAERVLGHFTRQAIPVLCVHDSFIIAEQWTEDLIRVMGKAAVDVVEREIRMDVKR